MMQQASDTDIISHAEDLVRRYGPGAIEGTPTASLVAEIEILADALRRHQPVTPAAGWNDAWERFDGKPASS